MSAPTKNLSKRRANLTGRGQNIGVAIGAGVDNDPEAGTQATVTGLLTTDTIIAAIFRKEDGTAHVDKTSTSSIPAADKLLTLAYDGTGDQIEVWYLRKA